MLLMSFELVTHERHHYHYLSAVNLDPSSSSKLNALFWAGFGIGRGGGILGTRFIKNSYYILGDCFGILVATICFVILSDNEKMLWSRVENLIIYYFHIADNLCFLS